MNSTNYTALAKQLALVTGRSPGALRQALYRHQGDVTRVLRDSESSPNAAIPCVYQGRHFPSRKALAEHLAPLTGRSVTALQVALARCRGDAERALRLPAPKAIPLVYQGQQFPSRAALAAHLAPVLGVTEAALRSKLWRYDGDVDRILLAARPRAPGGPSSS